MAESKSTAELYADYKYKLQKIADIKNALAVLGWDQETYLPEKGAGFRGQQITTLNTIAHELFKEPELYNILQLLKDNKTLDQVQQKNIQLSTEDFEKNKKYPAAFVAALSQATNESYHAWLKARKANDYRIFAPTLSRIIALKKQESEILGYEGHPYNALLNEFEKGANTTMLDTIFQEVRTELSPLLLEIAQQPPIHTDFLYRHYDRDKQWKFGLDLLKKMGFDMQAGRQDISEHPFTTSFNPQDVRVTTRIDENDLNNMAWSCIHEGGHALYEQGLPPAQYGLPCGEATSLGIHESQSRLWENNVGRGLHFWQYHYPHLQQLFPGNLEKVDLFTFYKAINKVQPSFIRTEADELTYHFHIMIRYEIEKGLIDGSIAVENLQQTWNEYYQKYLHVTVPDDMHGILQDIHWSHGSFGYFPTYSLGSFYAAQFFSAAQQQLPGLDANIAAGNYQPLLEWLRMHIHPFGRCFTSNELCEKVTGKKLVFTAFFEYAKKKYQAIYNL